MNLTNPRRPESLVSLTAHRHSARRRAPALVLFAAALVSLSAFPARGQSAPGAQPARGRPLAIEDFYRLKTVGSPELSPDGRWVAYVVSTRVEATNAETGAAWLVASDASKPALRVSGEGT